MDKRQSAASTVKVESSYRTRVLGDGGGQASTTMMGYNPSGKHVFTLYNGAWNNFHSSNHQSIPSFARKFTVNKLVRLTHQVGLTISRLRTCSRRVPPFRSAYSVAGSALGRIFRDVQVRIGHEIIPTEIEHCGGLMKVFGGWSLVYCRVTKVTSPSSEDKSPVIPPAPNTEGFVSARANFITITKISEMKRTAEQRGNCHPRQSLPFYRFDGSRNQRLWGWGEGRQGRRDRRFIKVVPLVESFAVWGRQQGVRTEQRSRWKSPKFLGHRSQILKRSSKAQPSTTRHQKYRSSPAVSCQTTYMCVFQAEEIQKAESGEVPGFWCARCHPSPEQASRVTVDTRRLAQLQKGDGVLEQWADASDISVETKKAPQEDDGIRKLTSVGSIKSGTVIRWSGMRLAMIQSSKNAVVRRSRVASTLY
ncbi:hypothetical protein CC1G_13793 [Coprinopsis cinerea okayama7|uniref:Uncharacterized protein n=1 Tax=Coprinopsis cinerea (strain Okayama-7 / 130 / ATCC MYA-4618 / FGSC 9003) TaxID=240176 RepID=D6RKA1_COPC7|nr:hypothetical protein CC1G_13793 [Coprinopsis cinerea okayama7\|eukprot:XP_002912262.1 hypothetical protein CC1G_13793 [Coprinopsis cinerea okayama7\